MLVDEYHDTNALQGEIIHALKPDGQGVTVAGDDAQAIYSLRAGTVRNILGFAHRYTPKAETIVLAQNYRSTQQILDCANALNSDGARQHRKTLFGAHQSGQRPLYVTLDDEAAQVEYIVGKIQVTREIGGSEASCGLVPQCAPQRCARTATHPAQYSLRQVRRFELPRSRAHEGHDVGPALGRQSAQHGCGVSRAEAVPGFDAASARLALDHFEAQGFSCKSLAAFDAPRAAAREWKSFCALLEKLADPATPWPGQVGLVRHWYRPQLERLYDGALRRASDLEQLEQLSVQHPGRERFLTELTLDPPTLTSDQSLDASNDEEYVILSTIHSAKGQEWDTVYVLNVTDGNFPSAAFAGNAEMIEEERRLLYVAITRARSELHLCAPLQFQATKQTGSGAAEGPGGRSRFMTDKVLEFCERTTFRSTLGADNLPAGDTAAVNVASRLKEMW